MSFFNKLFGGGKKASTAPTPAEAIQRLRDVEEMLTKKQVYLERKVEEEQAVAKKNASKNKRLALQALKKKKRFEKQLGQIDGTLTTIEQQREVLENANTNTEVLKIMGYAAKALKNAHQMDVDEVHDLMDEVQEQQDLADEITQVVSQPTLRGEYDDDELARELEELEQEQLNEELIEVVPGTSKLPDVTVDLEEEEELNKLKEFASSTTELPNVPIAKPSRPMALNS